MATTMMTLATVGIFLAAGWFPGDCAAGKIEVISTTCQYLQADQEPAWMTCPLDGGHRQHINSLRQLKDRLLSDGREQKFCCGSLYDRFCCSLQEKSKEVPAFDPSTHNGPDMRYLFKDGGFGFWTWLLLSSLAILLFGLIIYMASCVFVEIIDMLFQVLCCCFTNKKGGGKSSRQHRAESERLVAARSPNSSSPRQTSSDRNKYQAIAVPVQMYGSSSSHGLYQNVTPAAPPPYQEKA